MFPFFSLHQYVIVFQLLICIYWYAFTYSHSFIDVQSNEKFGTRKKRKENMRKAIDVELKKRKTLKRFKRLIRLTLNKIQTQQTLDEKYAQLSAERQELFWFTFTSSLLRIPSPTVMFCRRNFRMWFILSLASLLL